MTLPRTMPRNLVISNYQHDTRVHGHLVLLKCKIDFNYSIECLITSGI